MPLTYTTAPLWEPRWWCLGQEHRQRSGEAHRLASDSGKVRRQMMLVAFICSASTKVGSGTSWKAVERHRWTRASVPKRFTGTCTSHPPMTFPHDRKRGSEQRLGGGADQLPALILMALPQWNGWQLASAGPKARFALLDGFRKTLTRPVSSSHFIMRRWSICRRVQVRLFTNLKPASAN